MADPDDGVLTRPRSKLIFVQRSGRKRNGEVEMPIRRYMQEGAVFSPQALSAMSQALIVTVEILGIERDEAKRRDVARFLIRLMQEDGGLDAITLRDRAVAVLGDAAYCGLQGLPQPSNHGAGTESAAKRWFLHNGETGAL
jgi:hypothetical protein